MGVWLKSNNPFNCTYADNLVFKLEGNRRLRVVFFFLSRPYQFCIRKSGSVENNPTMKWYFKVLMTLSAELYLSISGEAGWYLMFLSFSRYWNDGNTSLSRLVCLGFRTLFYIFPCKSCKIRKNYLSILAFVGRTSITLLSYSYKTNKYLIPLLYITGNRPVRLVAIVCRRSMILLKTWLYRLSNFLISSSSDGVDSGVSVNWMFFLVCLTCPFEVVMEGGDVWLGTLLGWSV